MVKIQGKVWKYGDNINTDLIIPGKYKFKTVDLNELAKHVMEGIDPKFAENVKKGDVIVAGKNFGCGSSREQAPLALKYAGVGAVIAKSFARIFYRNSINVGLPIFESQEIYYATENGDMVEIDLESGLALNLTKKRSFATKPLPDFLLKIMQDGGLVEHFKKRGRFEWD
ncbi:MAG: 3-isopropylmalate dehydratase [Hadesarchaea archaeon YNP_N21]|nr:MAG: 3-isopropylmalate dehydratase [Hadesarchaea archaeon YNP_N21]